MEFEFAVLIALVVFLVGLFLAYKIGERSGRFRRDTYWKREVLNHRRDAVLKSRSVLSGQFSEQLAPYFPDFEFSPNDCRFIGRPVDFIVFNGSGDGEISEVVFVEVKGGKSKLSSKEKSLKRAIEARNVRWAEYRVPEDVFNWEDNFEK